MANCETKLSPTHIRYLLAMVSEQKLSGGLHCTSLAATLGVKKPSVHAMLGVLAQRGLVKRDAKGEMVLTSRGMQIGRRYQKCFLAAGAILKREFSEFCDEGEVCCLLLSKLSPAQLRALEHMQKI